MTNFEEIKQKSISEFAKLFIMKLYHKEFGTMYKSLLLDSINDKNKIFFNKYVAVAETVKFLKAESNVIND